MTISFMLKRSKAGFSMDDSLNGATIYVRLRDGRLLDSTASTGETVNPLWWDAKREEIKANIVCDNKEKAELNEKLQDLKKFLYSKHKVDKEKGKVNKEWLAKALKEYAKELGKRHPGLWISHIRSVIGFKSLWMQTNSVKVV